MTLQLINKAFERPKFHKIVAQDHYNEILQLWTEEASDWTMRLLPKILAKIGQALQSCAKNSPTVVSDAGVAFMAAESPKRRQRKAAEKKVSPPPAVPSAPAPPVAIELDNSPSSPTEKSKPSILTPTETKPGSGSDPVKDDGPSGSQKSSSAVKRFQLSSTKTGSMSGNGADGVLSSQLESLAAHPSTGNQNLQSQPTTASKSETSSSIIPSTLPNFRLKKAPETGSSDTASGTTGAQNRAAIKKQFTPPHLQSDLDGATRLSDKEMPEDEPPDLTTKKSSPTASAPNFGFQNQPAKTPEFVGTPSSSQEMARLAQQQESTAAQVEFLAEFTFCEDQFFRRVAPLVLNNDVNRRREFRSRHLRLLNCPGQNE